jgi:hypothetical protein
MLRRLGLIGLLLLGLGSAGTACLVPVPAPAPVVVARPAPGPCPGAFWVQGHYDRWGRWYPAHWRCPGYY